MRKTALALLVLSFFAFSAAAQDVVRSVNPEAVEFETPIFDVPGATGYRFELFVAGADPARDSPVLSKDVSIGSARQDGRLRLELKDLVMDAPNGRYVAVMRAVGVIPSPQSAPSEPFVLSNQVPPEERAEAAKRERFWTKISIAIGGSLLLVPLLVQ